jgi:MipA family protein
MNRIMVAALAAVILSAQARAQEDNSFQIGIGAGMLPDYEGSDEYQFIPFPTFDLKHEGFGLRSNRLGVEADLIPFQGIDAGPIVRYNMGRDNVDDNAVDQLPEVDGSVELGGYIGAGAPLSVLGVNSDAIVFAKLGGVSDLGGGHEGTVFEGSLGVIAPVSDDFTLITALNTSYMSRNYADAFFSVSSAGSATSSLSAFNADAGFKDVGVTVIGRYSFAENWSLTAIGGYTRLIGDAADSPIVDDRGDANQFFGAISLGCRF